MCQSIENIRIRLNKLLNPGVVGEVNRLRTEASRQQDVRYGDAMRRFAGYLEQLRGLNRIDEGGRRVKRRDG